MSDLGDRTEAATPRRRSEARKKGQVPRSPDLTSALVFLGLLVAVRNFGADTGRIIKTYTDTVFAHINTASFSAALVMQLAREGVLVLLKTAGPILVVGAVLGIVVNVAQTNGPVFATEALAPDFSRVNPAKGLQRFFSSRAFVDLGKSIFKIGIIGLIAFNTIKESYPQLVMTAHMDISAALGLIGGVLFNMAMRAMAAMLVLAAIDFFYQRWQHEKMLRMSKQEIKQEHKQSEGDPQWKARIRSRQRALSKKRMMAEVPKADVIITNPTHFAVALKYDSERMGAPIVVAKGQDLIAAKIRELAVENDVPIIENPPLARALYKEADIGREIPAALYEAVAEVLAFVYQINQRRAARAR
jgi:flagellar biosynthetic protein FlhB